MEKYIQAQFNAKGVKLIPRAGRDYWSGETGNIVITTHRHVVPGTDIDFRDVELRVTAVWMSQTKSLAYPVTIYLDREIAWKNADIYSVINRLLDDFVIKFYQSKAHNNDQTPPTENP